MVPEETKGNRPGPNAELRCKFDTGVGVNIMPISVFKGLSSAMFDTTGNALDKF